MASPKHAVAITRSRRSKEFYWRIKARNGNKVGIGGEGYKRRAGAKKSLRNVLLSAAELLKQLETA